MELLQHFIITRFNLPIVSSQRDGSKVDALNIDYLNERLDIFHKYTFPSIQNQTVQNFRWIVLFDANTPHQIKSRVSELREEYDRFYPCYLDTQKYHKDSIPEEYIRMYNEYSNLFGGDGYEFITDSEYIQRIVTPVFLNDIINSFGEKTRFVVTTRIDNDDLFHPRMIEDVQKRVQEEKTVRIYNYNNAYQLSINDMCLQKRAFLSNHCTTAVEDFSRSPYRTILYGNHRSLAKYPEYKEIVCSPLWIELIHKHNVFNDFKQRKDSIILFTTHGLREYPMLSDFKINKKKTFKIFMDIKHKELYSNKYYQFMLRVHGFLKRNIFHG